MIFLVQELEGHDFSQIQGLMHLVYNFNSPVWGSMTPWLEATKKRYQNQHVEIYTLSDFNTFCLKKQQIKKAKLDAWCFPQISELNNYIKLMFFETPYSEGIWSIPSVQNQLASVFWRRES